MKYLVTALISAVILTEQIPLVAMSSPNEKGMEMFEENFSSHFMSCRESIEQLGKNNPLVMQQFDSFIQNLTQAYKAGEGFIDKDVLRILDALVFAAEKHRFQLRKNQNPTPYIVHPIGVANHVMFIGKVRDPDIIIAALLHDTVEDTDTTFQELEENFGSRVAEFVREVTDDKTLGKQERKRLQIEHAPHKSAGAAQIKLGDKLYNLDDLYNEVPVGWDQARVDAYFHWAKEVVDRLPWVNAPLKVAIDEVVQKYWKENAQ